MLAVFSIRLVQLGLESPSAHRRGAGAGGWTAMRADITDRNGELLAATTAGFFIKVFPSGMTADAPEVLKRIDPSLSADRLLAITSSNAAALYINSSPLPAGSDVLGKARAARRDWIEIEERRLRAYSKRRAASHIVGFVGRDGRGLEGAEKFLDRRLRESEEPVALSIDFRVQSILHRELEITKRRHNAKMAAGILMDSLTGEIIAAVQIPDFDPENRDGVPARDITFWPLRGTYEMGSIFKLFNSALAYESGLKKSTLYDVSKPLAVGRHFVRDLGASRNRPNRMNIDDVFVWSSNIGSAKIALSMPRGKQTEFFRKIRLGEALDINGLGRTVANPVPRNSSDMDIASMSFGHGIAVSMMNLVAASNAMVNGGIFIVPRLTKALPGEALRGERVLSVEVSAKLREAMFRVSEETTGRLARVGGINIGSKTGTARKPVPGGYSATKNIASFVSVFPIESPKYILLIILDEPDAEPGVPRTAAHNVVPATGRILDSVVPMLIK